MKINRNNIEVCPFGAPLFKCDAWQLGAGAVGALGSLIGGHIGAKAQLKATRETNAANKQIAESNNNWNYKMFNEQNAYNSAVQQRLRLEQAGMNPYLMMNGGSAGTAMNAPTADESGKAVAPNIGETISSAYQGAFNHVSQAIVDSANVDNIKAQTEKTQAEADIAKSNARFQDQINSLNIDNMYKQGLLTQSQYEAMKLENVYNQHTMQSRENQQKSMELIAQHNAELLRMNVGGGKETN